MQTLVNNIAPSLAGAFGIAAIFFGEADDAPGLVMFGLLIVGGALVFGLRPSLRSRSRVIGFVIGAIAFTAVAALIAGWLENTF